MTIYKKVEVPRPDGFDSKRRAEYHALLRTSVFPLVDELVDSGLAEGYDFLTHSGIDLRLWLADTADLTDVQARLRTHGLPDQLADFAPAETGEDRMRLLHMLQRGAEQVRALMDDGGRCRSADEVVHWFLNQYGLHNIHELEFHRASAAAWENHLGSPSDST
jgi:hypothetical protein